MAQSNTTLWIILGSVAAVLVLGCLACGGVGVFIWVGAKKAVEEAQVRVKRLNDLKQVGMALHTCHDTFGRPPANFEQLRAHLGSPQVEDRIRRGEIQVVYDAARFRDQPAGTSNTLFAWDTRPEPNGNRLVVFMDGGTAILTPQEFQAKSKPVLMGPGK